VRRDGGMRIVPSALSAVAFADQGLGHVRRCFAA
jgi:hypothetical protein